ncbi:hypothetical protein SLEP1_g27755 [Rubroshorea leprosula]|uniref:Uncharacterized protein n=1 Tax=Rubroshorea leprosula TaxID=152421 RepID=A0AAV5K055_9ROSI|nr:hypothetical protein SLEP1_g27755 [Rubroshorea leprosula]
MTIIILITTPPDQGRGGRPSVLLHLSSSSSTFLSVTTDDDSNMKSRAITHLNPVLASILSNAINIITLSKTPRSKYTQEKTNNLPLVCIEITISMKSVNKWEGRRIEDFMGWEICQVICCYAKKKM